MTSVNFLLRPSSVAGRPARLFVRIINKRIVHNVSTAIQLFPHEWDQQMQAVIAFNADRKRSEYLAWAKRELENDQHFLENARWRLEGDGLPTAAGLAAAYRQNKKGGGMAEYVEKLIEELQARGQVRTARAYRTVLARLAGFTGNPSPTFKSITPLLVKSFEAQLLKEGLSLNSVSFYMRNLRAIYNKATLEGISQPHPVNPFRGVYTGREVTVKRALEREEMALLEKLEFAPQQSLESPVLPSHLRKALLLFLFSFYARGMPFVDIAFLKKENLYKNVITYKRSKTGRQIQLKVNKQLQWILAALQPLTEGSPYLLPIITRKGIAPRTQYESGLRTQNRRLGQLSRLLGMDRKITTHVARHTWASVAKGANLPLAVISEALGHASEYTTRIYLTSFDREVLDRANDTVAKAIACVV